MIPPWRLKDRKRPADKNTSDRGVGGDGKPPDRGPGSRRPIRRAGLGLFYLAIGRREGFEDFGNTADAYLASLAPLVAFNLVSSVVLAASGAVHVAVLVFLVSLCIMLASPAVSHPLCRRWGRAEQWPRYANILNWGQMLMFLVLAITSVMAKAGVEAGAPANFVEGGLRLATACYVIWFQWFVARGVLQISRWRTVVLLLALAGANALILAALLLTSVHLKMH